GLDLAGGLCAAFAILFLDFQAGDLRFWYGRRRALSGLDLAGGLCVAFAVLFRDFDLEALRFWHRQWHVPAGRDHVEFARKQHGEATGWRMRPAMRPASSPAPPVEIGARRADQRRSRVLRNHQAPESGN